MDSADARAPAPHPRSTVDYNSGSLRLVFGVPLVAGAAYLGHQLGGDGFAAVFGVVALLLVVGTGGD